ncbi:MAG TPA: LLM class flavin-dependent oxidoreductase [Ilumatobacter sp.]|nr:LLM class flavin-dependent oxidoreductase [Ilumatobacter sp.]
MTTRPIALSVLDLVPVHRDQSSAQAVAASVSLAQAADRLGYRRYWFAEHHNMPSVASTSPAVLIGAVASATESIRVGSGGVMLPNHSPFVVAEQFATLEAIAPGRIDLGIGRAPGSDQVVTALLRSSGPVSDVERFPSHVNDIIALLSADGAELTLRNSDAYNVRATPSAGGIPTVWLLGSSDYSAQVAAQMGLPYVFAYHFSGEGIERALELYRANFVPSPHLDAPRTFLTLNVVAADTRNAAIRLAMPNLIQMSRLRTGKPLTALARVEDVADIELDGAQRRLIEVMQERWVIDSGDAAASRIQALADRFGVDEVMVSVGAALGQGDDPRRGVARERTLELLAERLL